MRSFLLPTAVVILELQSAFAISVPKKWTSFVVFGDSYTDEGRLNYFGGHSGSAPPLGWQPDVNNDTSTGGYIWPRYVSRYTDVHLYDYAVSGAVCSNKITPRTWSYINAPFPAVAEYEVPAFIRDSQRHTGYKPLNVPQSSTIYAMWIGTNDVGNYAFLTDSQIAGKTISDYVDCVYEQLDQLYKNGGRYFVLMNVAPLQLSPMYATLANGGTTANRFWQDKSGNITEIAYRMWETVDTVNMVYKYRTPAECHLNSRYRGAQIASFDVHGLIQDIYNHPKKYLNGTAPLNVKSWINQCDVTGSNCTRRSSPDSYLWFDELHPSEQADRIIAKNFVDIMTGKKNPWVTRHGECS